MVICNLNFHFHNLQDSNAHVVNHCATGLQVLYSEKVPIYVRQSVVLEDDQASSSPPTHINTINLLEIFSINKCIHNIDNESRKERKIGVFVFVD